MRATASTRASVRRGEARGRPRQYTAHHVVLEVEPGDRGPGGSRGRGTADRERERRLDAVLGGERTAKGGVCWRASWGRGRRVRCTCPPAEYTVPVAMPRPERSPRSISITTAP